MTTLALLLIFPLLWPFVAKVIWKHELTLPEMAVNILLGAIILVGGWHLSKYIQTADTEILNGQVVSKDSQHVSCSHSYSCNCKEVCSGSGKNRSCSPSCDTCYEHAYDVDWHLRSTAGTVKVPRVNRRGDQEPPRFTRAQPGDPVALDSTFTNYIKASPESLFSTEAEKTVLDAYKEVIPAYPLRVYDLHYVDRVLGVGVALDDPRGWNHELALRLRNLGPQKEVNVVVVFTNQPPAFADALRVAWLGGKKNDVVVVLGTPKYPAIEWSRVFSWSDRELFKVELRDALAGLKTADRKAVLDTLETHIQKSFVRRPSQDFEYLDELIEPPAWAIALVMVLTMGASVGASVLLSRNSITSARTFRSRW